MIARLAKALGLALVSLLLFVGCKKPPETLEPTSYSSIRDEVVKRVKTGEIKISQTGPVTLPPEFQPASMNGTIWAAQDAGAGWLIAFPLASRVKMEFLVYAEKALPADAQTVPIGSLSLRQVRRVEGHWYQASFNAPAGPR